MYILKRIPLINCKYYLGQDGEGNPLEYMHSYAKIRNACIFLGVYEVPQNPPFIQQNNRIDVDISKVKSGTIKPYTEGFSDIQLQTFDFVTITSQQANWLPILSTPIRQIALEVQPGTYVFFYQTQTDVAGSLAYAWLLEWQNH